MLVHVCGLGYSHWSPGACCQFLGLIQVLGEFLIDTSSVGKWYFCLFPPVSFLAFVLVRPCLDTLPSSAAHYCMWGKCEEVPLFLFGFCQVKQSCACTIWAALRNVLCLYSQGVWSAVFLLWGPFLVLVLGSSSLLGPGQYPCLCVSRGDCAELGRFYP